MIMRKPNHLASVCRYKSVTNLVESHRKCIWRETATHRAMSSTSALPKLRKLKEDGSGMHIWYVVELLLVLI